MAIIGRNPDGRDPNAAFVPELSLEGELAGYAHSLREKNDWDITNAANSLGIRLPLGEEQAEGQIDGQVSASDRWTAGVADLYRIGDESLRLYGSHGTDFTHYTKLLADSAWGQGVLSPNMRFVFHGHDPDFEPLADSELPASPDIDIYDIGLRRTRGDRMSEDLVYAVKPATLDRLGKFAVSNSIWEPDNPYVALEWLAGRELPDNSPFAEFKLACEQMVPTEGLSERIVVIQAFRKALVEFGSDEVKKRPEYAEIQRAGLFPPHFIPASSHHV